MNMNIPSFSTTEEFIAFLRSLVANLYRSPAGALVSLALVPEEQGYLFAAGRVLFEDAKEEPRGTLVYPNLILHEKWVEGANQAVDGTFELLSNAIKIDGRPVFAGLTSPSGRRRVQESDQQSGWPEWMFRTYQGGPNSRQGHLPREAVVAFGNRPFLSGEHASTEWVFRDAWRHGRRGPNEHHLLIVVPDTRARITESTWVRDTARVVVEMNVPRSDIQLQTLFLGTKGRADVFTSEPGDLTELSVPEGTQEILHALVHASGAVLGEIHLTQFQRVFEQSSEHPLPIVEQAQLDVAGGETDEVEFKSFIKPGTTGSEKEFIESVVAFANTRGGRIYLGVTDHREIQPRGELYGCYGPKDPTAELIRWVNKVIADKVKPVPRWTAEIVEVAGERVAQIAVDEGRQKPYATYNNYIYIRKGSSDVQPDPTTELRLLLESNGQIESDEA